MNLKIAVAFLFAALVSLAIATPVSAEQTERGRAMLVLDASGSMWGQIGGRNKVEIARDAIADMLLGWDAEIDIGLMAYGHRRKGDCGDIEEVVPVRPGQAAKVSAAVQGLGAVGKTPLSAAVITAADRLQYQQAPATVILVTDGLENCGQDPCAVARSLAQNGVAFVTHVVGFDLGAGEAAQLGCLADLTGGVFIEASNGADLTEALRGTMAETTRALGPSQRFHVVLSEGADILPSGFYAKNLRWQFFPRQASGALGQRMAQSSGASAVFDPDAGRYSAVLKWDAVTVEYPFEAVAEEQAAHRVVLDAAILTLSASLRAGGPLVSDQVGWTVYAVTEDGGRGVKLGYKAGAEVQMVVPAGDIEVVAKLRGAQVGERQVFAPGAQQRMGFNLDAARVRYVLRDGNGAVLRGHQTWTAHRRTTDGTLRKVDFVSGSGATTYLPAGDLVIEVQANGRKIQHPLVLVAGVETEVSITHE